ncbi:SDR family oxidoreductase [Pseudooceanicola sp. CBS1P-1]|uniref:SDR family NAD(P)-dependent oxidoreductase n=1 Tax=Pseudooceanicola albus TaxID=2692189 RepID=A0A6L7G071_9RHOB|nr:MULTISPECIES: SDR family oxidoreductase [Pseudooceanicola]MBT9382314.1 SDR family oxidoreductase [Pseudooceanicola endophyticus]MXN16856.1 SDR family NAD(P)-dependent oxidoreductase [Pseudooceanicola albus]
MAKNPGTALVTGASSGIGEALARIHAEQGGDLVLVARRRAPLEALKQELEARHGIAASVLVEDLTDEAAPARIHQSVLDAGQDIACLFNNAGFGGLGRFDQRDWAADRAMMQVNMIALTALTRLFLPEFVARGSGRILNTSSSGALLPGPMQAVYYASKAYVTSFSNALSEELRGTGVTVTALMPGPVRTGFEATAGMGQLGLYTGAASAGSVAKAGYDAMMQGRLNVITGLSPVQRLMLRLLPFAPRRLVLRMIHDMQTA